MRKMNMPSVNWYIGTDVMYERSSGRKQLYQITRVDEGCQKVETFTYNGWITLRNVSGDLKNAEEFLENFEKSLKGI